MNNSAAPLETLIDELKRLPGIGDKSATRLAYQLMNLSEQQTENLVQAIRGVHVKLNRCCQCQNYTEGDTCPICADPSRDHTTICVVETPRDVQSIERTREYRGLYHVLYGLINPVKGIGPENLTIRQLLARLTDDQVKEVIMGLPPSVEGDATSSTWPAPSNLWAYAPPAWPRAWQWVPVWSRPTVRPFSVPWRAATICKRLHSVHKNALALLQSCGTISYTEGSS